MKVTAFIRNKTAAKNNVTDQATIYFRIRDGLTDIKVASELTINPNHWCQFFPIPRSYLLQFPVNQPTRS